jgi:hypothetical protein
MIKMKFIVFLTFLVIGYHSTWATHYFISNKGNDHNNGTSRATPWLSLQTIAKNSQRFQRGDSILFERGSIFREQLDFSNAGIYLGFI